MQTSSQHMNSLKQAIASVNDLNQVKRRLLLHSMPSSIKFKIKKSLRWQSKRRRGFVEKLGVYDQLFFKADQYQVISMIMGGATVLAPASIAQVHKTAAFGVDRQALLDLPAK